MQKLIHILIIILLCSISSQIDAQSKKKFKRNKGTSKREIKKRQQTAFEKDERNAFNPQQPMGARQNDNRDDLLWHGETANTVYDQAVNLSLISPSRYGIKPGLEISSQLFLNYWVPNLYIKKRWRNDNWYVSSKHGFYSATPGLNWINKRNYTSILEHAEEIPFILSMKNELLVSRLIMNHDRCGRDKPYIIITGGIGVDFGVPFGDSDLQELKGHMLANRSPALTGSGYTAYIRARADWQMTPILMLGGGLKYFRGDFSGNSAVEQNTELQTIITPRFTVSVGYILSFANYVDTNGTAILPFFDLTYYFGKRQGRQKGLFGKGM
ncbi:MAG: hypothetical protein MI866_23260 [Bacteroidales bacterium]|nr:hypothetical protein [Bacteroidales bacterium]